MLTMTTFMIVIDLAIWRMHGSPGLLTSCVIITVTTALAARQCGRLFAASYDRSGTTMFVGDRLKVSKDAKRRQMVKVIDKYR
jgi:hypothetical protein